MVYSRDLPKMAVMDHLGFSWTTILDYFLGLLSWTILDLTQRWPHDYTLFRKYVWDTEIPH